MREVAGTGGTQRNPREDALDVADFAKSPVQELVASPDDKCTGTIDNDEALPTMTLVLAEDTIRESDDPNQTGNQHRTTVTATLDIAIEGDLRISIRSGPALRVGNPANLEEPD